MKKTNYVIFSDLDDTLLDSEDYSHQAAEPALEAIQAAGIPLVFCTSKTRREVEAIRDRLWNEHPFIVENGGAVFIPRGYFPFSLPAWKSTRDYDVIELGVPYREVVAALRRAAESSGCPARGFHDMSIVEIALRCRMSVIGAERAKAREYDEPFEVLSRRPALVSGLLSRIRAKGFMWTRGSRFHHISGPHSKGRAVAMLAALFRRLNQDLATVALGDGPNDLSMFQAVDLPIVIPTPGGPAPSQQRWRTATESTGPQGWNQAVLRFLREADLAPAC